MKLITRNYFNFEPPCPRPSPRPLNKLTRTAVIPYYKSQKRILIDGIEILCQQLGRPICSADLKGFYKNHPERRPILKKRMGQILLAAARDMGQAATQRIFPVGLFRGKAYYAPSPSPEWESSFFKYRAAQQLTELNSLPMADSLALLDELASADEQRHYLGAIRARWLLERKLLQERIKGGVGVESPKLPRPPDLKDRSWAKEFLLNQTEGRRLSTQALSTSRHLAALLWPQSILWEGASGFLPAQVDAYVRWHWTSPGENHVLFRACTVVLRYGITPLQIPGN